MDDRLSHLFVFSDRLAIFFLDDIVGDFSSSFSLSFLLSSPGGDWLLFASTLFPSLRLSFSRLSLLRSSTTVEVLFRSVLSLFPCISFFPGDYLSPAGEPRPTAQARRTIKKHGGGMADVAGICWRTPLSRRTAASRRTIF